MPVVHPPAPAPIAARSRSSHAASTPPNSPPRWPIQLIPGVPGIATCRIVQYSSPATIPTPMSSRFLSKKPRATT